MLVGYTTYTEGVREDLATLWRSSSLVVLTDNIRPSWCKYALNFVQLWFKTKLVGRSPKTAGFFKAKVR